MLESVYDRNGVLQEAFWQWIEKANLPADLLLKLQAEAAKLKQKRVAAAKAERGKIGRNAPYPCGSGKKYK